MLKLLRIFSLLLLTSCAANDKRPDVTVCSIDNVGDLRANCSHTTNPDDVYVQTVYNLDKWICLTPDDFNSITKWYLKRCEAKGGAK